MEKIINLDVLTNFFQIYYKFYYDDPDRIPPFIKTLDMARNALRLVPDSALANLVDDEWQIFITQKRILQLNNNNIEPTAPDQLGLARTLRDELTLAAFTGKVKKTLTTSANMIPLYDIGYHINVPHFIPIDNVSKSTALQLISERILARYDELPNYIWLDISPLLPVNDNESLFYASTMIMLTDDELLKNIASMQAARTQLNLIQ